MAMTLEKLKKLKADGVIDQAEYEETLEKFGLKDDDKDDPLAGLDDKTKAAIQKMLQSERDREANRVGNEKKGEIERLTKELETLRKEKLSDKELRDLDQQKLDDQKREFALIQNKYTAAQSLKSAGLDNSDEVVDLVVGSDKETTEKNVKTLSAVIDRLVKAKVEEKFKDSGRDPGKGGSGGGAENPWMDGHINYTKQMEIESTDPELAKQLKAAAGKK